VRARRDAREIDANLDDANLEHPTTTKNLDD